MRRGGSVCFLSLSQFITKCKNERIVEIGQHLSVIVPVKVALLYLGQDVHYVETIITPYANKLKLASSTVNATQSKLKALVIQSVAFAL